jgi:hypothetical protein
MTSGSNPAAKASFTLLLPNSDNAISEEKEGAHASPNDKVMRSRKSEIRN